MIQFDLRIFFRWVEKNHQQPSRSEQEPSQRRWFGPKMLHVCSRPISTIEKTLNFGCAMLEVGNSQKFQGKSRLEKYYSIWPDGIVTYIWLTRMLNVGKCSVHGEFGITTAE